MQVMLSLEGANRVLNLQNEWGKVLNQNQAIPQACTVINNRISEEEYKLFYEVLKLSTRKNL